MQVGSIVQAVGNRWAATPRSSSAPIQRLPCHAAPAPWPTSASGGRAQAARDAQDGVLPPHLHRGNLQVRRPGGRERPGAGRTGSCDPNQSQSAGAMLLHSTPPGLLHFAPVTPCCVLPPAATCAGSSRWWWWPSSRRPGARRPPKCCATRRRRCSGGDGAPRRTADADGGCQ